MFARNEADRIVYRERLPNERSPFLQARAVDSWA
jgi:hypothetical protein